jgi:hypothetical protein
VVNSVYNVLGQPAITAQAINNQAINDNNNVVNAQAVDVQPVNTSGFFVNSDLRYRLSRPLIAGVGFDAATGLWRGRLGLEYREGEFTLAGTGLIERVNALRDSYGLQTSLKYTPEAEAYRLNAGVFVGAVNRLAAPNPGTSFSLGFEGGLDYDFTNDDGDSLGSVNVGLTYDPWRLGSTPLRLAAGGEWNLNPGTVFAQINVGGGDSGARLGLRVGYRLDFASLGEQP